MKKVIKDKKAEYLLWPVISVLICILLCACTGGQDTGGAGTPTQPEAQVSATQAPTATPAATPTPEPTATPIPTPTPVPTVRDVYSATDDACVYYTEPQITGIDMMDVESLGERLLLIYQIYDAGEDSDEDWEGSEDDATDAGTDTNTAVRIYTGKHKTANEPDVKKDGGAYTHPDTTPDGDDYDSDYSDEDYNPDAGYTLYFKSVDPVTLEGDEYSIPGRSYYASQIDVLNDGLFSVYYYGSGPYMLFNDRLELLTEIDLGEDVSIAHFSHDGRWLWYMDTSEKLYRRDVASGDTEEIELPDRKGNYYLNEGEGSGIIRVGCTAADYSSGKAYYYDEDSAVLLGDTPQEISYSFSPDRTQALRFETGDICRVQVFNAAPDNMFPGEDITDEETGDIIKNADEAVCTIKIANTEEAYSRFIDWDRGYYISCSDYFSPEGNIVEYSCYSMLTGEKISNYNISGNGFVTLYHTLDSKDGILYAEWVKDGAPKLNAWEYAQDSVQDYRNAFGKFSDIPEAADARRRELEEKYDFNFYLGSEVFSSSFDYTLLLCSDYEKAVAAMDMIDEVLSIYPEGFFEQFKIDGIKTLSIYLCGGFEPKAANTISDAIAIATVNNYERMLALDINWESSLKRTLVHEISHWIDGRIASQAQFGGYSTYDEDWLEQNPSDFSYRYSYVGGYTAWKYIFSTGSDNGKAYFIDQYSQTYPTEDRARLFEYLMYPDEDGTDYGYLKAANLQRKLEFYFDVIRKCFDTDKWPERTVWEEKLDALVSERIKNDVEKTGKDLGGNRAE